MAKSDQLKTFLLEHGSLPFVWGQVDCLLAPADWCVARGNDDPASPWRGTYDSEEQCREIVEREGGLLSIALRSLSWSHIPMVDRQETGAVAVIGSISHIHRQWGAIWDGARWQVRLSEGFVSVVAKPLAIWMP